MTSLSRKKPPTTARNTPPARAVEIRGAAWSPARLSAEGLRLCGWLAVWAVCTVPCQGQADHVIPETAVAAPARSVGWTSPRNLPDSTTHLRWLNPRQAATTPVYPPRPSYLRSPTAATTATLPGQLAASPEVVKVSHNTPVQTDQPTVAERSTPTATEPLHSESADDAGLTLQPAANAQRRVVTYVAQQPKQLAPSDDDADAVFADEIDDLLPGEELVPTSDASEPDDIGLPAATDEFPEVEPLVPRPTPAEMPTEDSLVPDPTPAEMPTEDPLDPAWPLEPPDQLPSLDNDGLPSLDALPTDGQGIEPLPGPPEVAPDEFLDEAPLGPGEFDREVAIDCPDEILLFQQAWDELRKKPLSSISLDITPSMRPNRDPEQDVQARQELASRTASRTWRDKQGRVLAEGQLQDFRDGDVLVQTPEGRVEPVCWYELSNEDLCYVSSAWELPEEFSPATGQHQVRNWTMLTFTWTASAVCHKPLYFEDVQLERYGHSAGPVSQAMLSGVHFFGNIFFLPYHMGLNPPNECQYALGYYRPGSCAPWMLPAIPLSARGARWQAAALIGGIALLP